jgi:hypothetical protein
MMVRSLAHLRKTLPASLRCAGTARARGLADSRHPILAILGAVAILALAAPGPYAQVVGSEVQVSSYSRWQSEPSVAALGDHLLAAWNNRLYVAGGAGWGFSVDGGLTWTDAQLFPTNQGTVAGGQATVCVDRAGDFYTATLSGDGCGWAIGVYRGVFQGPSFVWQSGTLAVPCFNANTVDIPIERPWLACDPERGYLYLSYTRMVPVPNGTSYYTHQMTIYFTRSLDRGATWSAPVALSSTTCNGSQPAVGPDGELYIVWEDIGAQKVLASKSVDFGATFGPAITIAPTLDNLGTRPRGWEAPTWRYSPLYPPLDELSGPDFPSIVVDRTAGPRRGTVYVAWADYAAGTVGPSTGTVQDPEPNDFFASAAPFTLGNDIVGYAPTVDGGHSDCDRYRFDGVAGTTIWINGSVLFANPGTSDGSPNISYYSLYCGQDTTQEVFFVPIQDGRAPPLPPQIYTLPVTGRYYIAMTCPNYSSYAYQLQTRVKQVAPGQAARDFRDIVLVSSSDGGATWSTKRRINDDAPQYDNVMPSLSVDGLGTLHAAWYDRRDDPGCGALVNTYWAESLDGGVTFLPSQRVSGQPGSWDYQPGGSDITNFGDHLGITSSDDRTWVLWTDDRPPTGLAIRIYAVTIGPVPTAVAVSGFRAEVRSESVILRWNVADPTGLVGFRVQRAAADGNYLVLDDGALLLAHGAGEYTDEDRTVARGTSYHYRLEAVGTDGAHTLLGPLDVVIPGGIDHLAWEGARPNPFTTSLALTLAVPRSGEARVRVFDLLGHEVATLARGPMGAGRQTVGWDGRDRTGRAVPPGVYLVRAELGRESSGRRVIRIQ